MTSRVIGEDEVVGAQLVAFAIGSGETGNIWALFVHPAFEAQGYGRRLHDEMLAWLWRLGLQRLGRGWRAARGASSGSPGGALDRLMDGKLLLVTDAGDLLPERALSLLRRIGPHRVTLNGTQPVAGLSSISQDRADILSALTIKKPTIDAQLTHL